MRRYTQGGSELPHTEDSRTLRDFIGDDHERRMEAARRRAEWELGDESWAGVLIGAYLWPEEDTAALAAEESA